MAVHSNYIFFISASFLYFCHFMTSSDFTDERYFTCPRGRVSSATELETYHVRSVVECCSMCLRVTACVAINICNVAPPLWVNCTLLKGPIPQGCESLRNTTDGSCFYMQSATKGKEEVTTEKITTETIITTTHEPLVCQNGGTSNGTYCACTVKYGGRTCERLIRDCSEAYNNGYRSNYDGLYTIKPMTSPTAFVVLCEFSWGGCTYPLRRYSSSNFNLNWTTAKTGVIKDLLASTINSNFFIGLDNLHHLTNQAGYNNHVFISYNSWQSQGSAFYDYFKIGNESTSYAITYKTFYPGSNPGDNGFNAPSPIVFCTQDHDTNACAQQMGSPGWYGSNCNGYSMFSSSFKWPVNGADKNLDMLVFNLVRLTPFLDE